MGRIWPKAQVFSSNGPSDRILNNRREPQMIEIINQKICKFLESGHSTMTSHEGHTYLGQHGAIKIQLDDKKHRKRPPTRSKPGHKMILILRIPARA